MSTFTPFEEKMESAGVPAAAVKAFSRCYEALVSNHSGMIPEMDIQPADQVEDWQDITASTPAADKDLISQCVCIKLNGGLGTSMGLQKAKSLLKVKGEDTFLDLIVRQVKHLRSISGTPVRLLLMNSFSTSADTLAYLEKYASDGFADPAQVELMQNRVPGSSPSRPRPTCSCCVRTPSPWMKTARWPWLRNGKEKLPLWTWTPSCTSWWTPWTAWACLP